MNESTPAADCDAHVVTHPRRHRGPEVKAVLTEIRRAWHDLGAPT